MKQITKLTVLLPALLCGMMVGSLNAAATHPQYQSPIQAFGTPPLYYQKLSTRTLIQGMSGKFASGDRVDWTTWVVYDVNNVRGNGNVPIRRQRAWFECLITNSSGGFNKIDLIDIGAQSRLDTMMLRIDPAAVPNKVYLTTIRIISSGAEIVLARQQLTTDFVMIAPAYAAGKPINDGSYQTKYQLEFTGGSLKFECFLADHPPVDADCASDVQSKETDDGFPPPGDPGDLN